MFFMFSPGYLLIASAVFLIIAMIISAIRGIINGVKTVVSKDDSGKVSIVEWKTNFLKEAMSLLRSVLTIFWFLLLWNAIVSISYEPELFSTVELVLGLFLAIAALSAELVLVFLPEVFIESILVKRKQRQLSTKQK